MYNIFAVSKIVKLDNNHENTIYHYIQKKLLVSIKNY